MTEENLPKKIGEIERKLNDGESLLRKTRRSSIIGWFFILIGLLIVLFIGDIFIIIGLLIIAASIWRLFKTNKYRNEIEEGLREYRGQKAELQAKLVEKKD